MNWYVFTETSVIIVGVVFVGWKNRRDQLKKDADAATASEPTWEWRNALIDARARRDKKEIDDKARQDKNFKTA